MDRHQKGVKFDSAVEALHGRLVSAKRVYTATTVQMTRRNDNCCIHFSDALRLRLDGALMCASVHVKYVLFAEAVSERSCQWSNIAS